MFKGQVLFYFTLVFINAYFIISLFAFSACQDYVYLSLQILPWNYTRVTELPFTDSIWPGYVLRSKRNIYLLNDAFFLDMTQQCICQRNYLWKNHAYDLSGQSSKYQLQQNQNSWTRNLMKILKILKKQKITDVSKRTKIDSSSWTLISPKCGG